MEKSAKKQWYWDNPEFDDKALERQVEAAFAAGTFKKPVWRYPAPKSYNGFSGEQRVAGWTKTWAGVRMGLIPPPRQCSVCLVKGRMQMHAEHYDHPLLAKPICPSCHRSLHMRFRAPEQWLRRVEKYGGCGQWFEKLGMDRIVLT